MLTNIGGGTRWSALDESLSRTVLVTAFPNDENTAICLEAARMASGAMDARFLRILDAGQDADGAFVVSEKADGASLSEVLSLGPLSGEESAFVIREIAEGLATAHTMQQYHCRLDPSKIFLSTTGEVKILGLRLDQTLTPRENDHKLIRSDMEAMDVVACGGLLYSCLTATWPGAADVGLPSSPRNPEGLKPPIHVRPGTSVELNRLTTQILSLKDPEHIDTAFGVAEAMGSTLGSKDPTPWLVDRVAQLTENAQPVLPSPPIPGQAQRPTIVPARDLDEQSLTVVVDAHASPEDPSDQPLGGFTVNTKNPAVPLRPPIPPDRARAWSRVFLALVVLVILALMSSVIIGLYHSARSPKVKDTPTPSTELTIRPIMSGAAFDSKEDGGSGWERPEEIPYAFDGDISTAWHTEEYEEPVIPTKKPGVGLILDLGSAVPVSQATLTINLRPTSVTIYVPAGDAAAVEAPDMISITHWTPVVQSELTEPVTTLDFSSVTTRYVIVYITRVVDLSNGNGQADFAEIVFAG
jgi:putative peptidoglycan lipid II flippase